MVATPAFAFPVSLSSPPRSLTMSGIQMLQPKAGLGCTFPLTFSFTPISHQWLHTCQDWFYLFSPSKLPDPFFGSIAHPPLALCISGSSTDSASDRVTSHCQPTLPCALPAPGSVLHFLSATQSNVPSCSTIALHIPLNPQACHLTSVPQSHTIGFLPSRPI